jgi:hypothetical protein
MSPAYRADNCYLLPRLVGSFGGIFFGADDATVCQHAQKISMLW